MKSTIKIIMFLCVLFVSSCAPKQNDMLTVIHPDGSCYREFSENVDREFLMGNFSGSHNPFPPYVDSTWQFEWAFNNSEPRTDFPLKKAVVDSIYKLIPTSSNNDSNASEKYVKVIARRSFIRMVLVIVSFQKMLIENF